MTVAELFAAATGHHRAGRLADAEAAYRTLLGQVDHTDARQLLALVLAQRGRPAEALPLLERCVAADPRRPDWLTNLGELYRQLERPADAVAAFRRAIALAPQLPEAHYNLANVLKASGQHADAITHYTEATRLRPDYAQAHYNLANALREEGRLTSAAAAYRRALQLQPNWSDAHLNLANALTDAKELDAAIHHYTQAAAGKPNDPDLFDSLGHVYASQGRTADAVEQYRRALALVPGDAYRTLRLAGVGPPVPANAAAADEDRLRIAATLEQLEAKTPTFDLAKLHSSGAEPPMRLAYHGRDDLPLKRRWANLFAERLPSFDPPAKHDGKPRVGVVVTRGHEGVYARCLGELVERLDRTILDVCVVCSRSGANVLRHMLPAATVPYFVIPERVDEAATLLRAERFDVLHFWECGTDSLNYFLPFFRPARVVSTTWGWPVTSGVPGVHDYVSCAELEPADGDAHYSERLVRLRAFPTYYLRPPVAQHARRADHGLSDGERVYLCGQNVRKLQPDFDATLAAILRHDGGGRVVLIADEQPGVTAQLRVRLDAALGDVASRLTIAPRLERDRYMGLVACADVLLDPPHYGGGANTVYDAAAAGVPTVTVEGRFHRTRWAAAVNRRLGVPELNADDLAATAARVANDRTLRDDVVRRIRTAAGALFEDATAVVELQEYFVQAAAS